MNIIKTFINQINDIFNEKHLINILQEYHGFCIYAIHDDKLINFNTIDYTQNIIINLNDAFELKIDKLWYSTTNMIQNNLVICGINQIPKIIIHNGINHRLLSIASTNKIKFNDNNVIFYHDDHSTTLDLDNYEIILNYDEICIMKCGDYSASHDWKNIYIKHNEEIKKQYKYMPGDIIYDRNDQFFTITPTNLMILTNIITTEQSCHLGIDHKSYIDLIFNDNHLIYVEHNRIKYVNITMYGINQFIIYDQKFDTYIIKDIKYVNNKLIVIYENFIIMYEYINGKFQYYFNIILI